MTPNNKILLRIILSAKNPNINIDIPDRMMKEKAKIPNGVIFLPNPKYFDITSRFGEIIYWAELIKATIVINNIKESIELFLVLLFIMIIWIQFYLKLKTNLKSIIKTIKINLS